jgi:hypothetical protein
MGRDLEHTYTNLVVVSLLEATPSSPFTFPLTGN